MPSFVLTDTARDLWVETFALDPEILSLPGDPAWSVSKTRLRGGRRDGVDLIRLDNGALSLAIIPSRGMNLWKGRFGEIELGWKSPVSDGPVHPSLVDAQAWGGLGWLDGFDELLARCGLESNGPPFEENGRTFTLHGRISNIPAHFVAIHIDDAPPHAITVEGHVCESRLFSIQTQMVTKITTIPGSNRVTVRDEFTNLRDSPGELQILYHWNFGSPLLEQGSRFVAPLKAIIPKDAEATRDLDHVATYGPPSPGAAEKVYLMQLLGDGPTGQTLAMLRNQESDKGVALRFSTEALPAFTLWKCERGTNEGYVTGLEPATNYPNARPFEKARGRVVTLAPGQTYAAEMVLEVCEGREQVAKTEAEIARLQGRGMPRIHAKPEEPFVSEG